MPNGTGKTTTLELLRAALSGSAERWDAQHVASLRKKGAATVTGHFSVRVLCNGQRITVELNFDFEDNKAFYRTTATTGYKQGFRPPPELRKFLRPEFVNFFVFDGELAERLLDREYTNAQDAIDNLFQLDLFESVRARIIEYWEEQVANRGATEERGRARRTNRVAQLKKRLSDAERELQRWTAERDDAQQKLDDKKKRFNAALVAQREFGEKLRKAESELETAKGAVATAQERVLADMREPQALSAHFALEIVSLKESLDRVRLPETAAREFFEELALEAECVCGRELDDAGRQAIRERAPRYLGSDDVSLLNAMKSDIATHIDRDPSTREKALTADLDALRTACEEQVLARTERDSIRSESVAGNPELESAQAEIETLQTRVREAEDEIERYTNFDDSAGDDSWGVDVLKRRVKEAEDKLAEVTQTLTLKRQRDVLSDLLRLAQARARDGICREIAKEADARIAEVMPHNQIRVEDIRRCLVLRGQEGGSVGETLSVAYAFLATLFNRSDHSLPFIVDSPAGPIDLAVRPRVAELIPKLGGQFIAFTISSERQGFLEPLEKASKQAPQYITMFRKGDAALEQRARLARPTITDDGIAVAGREFFVNFHLDKD